MPARLLDGAVRDAIASVGASRTIGALLASRRIVLLEHTLSYEVGVQRGAFIAQEESLPAVAHQHERAGGNADVCAHADPHRAGVCVARSKADTQHIGLSPKC